MTLSTHVLDAAAGTPAAGVPVRLEFAGIRVAVGHTDDDGRVKGLPTEGAGTYRLIFDTSALSTFFPEVVLTFRVRDPAAHLHVPLLLSPFAYSTYRGS